MQRSTPLLLAGLLGIGMGALVAACSSGDAAPSFVGTGAGGSGASGGGDAGAPPGAGGGDAGAPPDAGPPPDPTEKVFDPGILHQIDIVYDAATYRDQLENDPENRVPCTITFDGETTTNAGFRKKGGYGSIQPLDGKPGFSIKLNEFEKGKDLHGLTRLLLNNAVQDPTFLHEHLGYEVYRRAGIAAQRTAHGLVTLNGAVYGLYVVAEAVDKKFLERNYGAESREGNLYEGPAFVDFVTAPEGMELKDEIEDMRTRDDIAALASIVNTVPDDQFAAKASQKMDLDGFIRGFAIDAIFYHWDGYSYWVINNYFMFDDPVTNRFVFMPHGMDQLFNDVYFDVNSWPNGRVSQRVRSIPDLDAKFHAQITDVLQTVWDVPSLLARIDKVTEVVHTTTSTDPRMLGDLASYDAHVEETRQAVALRKSLLLGLPLNVCGNGVVEVNEDCDDGNTVSGDGCSSVCFQETCVAAEHGGSHYAICPDLHNIAESRSICASYGGSLAVPMNAEEHDWMVATAFGVAEENYWIGVSDEQSEGVWVGPDGSFVTYFNWSAGNPNGMTAQNCVILAQLYGGQWNDKACTEEYGVVCKVP